MDQSKKKSIQRRLRIIEGQVKGLSSMVEEERYCVEILTQVAAIQEALRGASREIFQNHLETCVRSAFERGEGDVYTKEVADVIFRLGR